MSEKRCQMTISECNSLLNKEPEKCNKKAKYINPYPKMGVKYVCATHANSLNKMYERIGQKCRCELIT